MDSSAAMMLGVVFCSVGMGYIVYGRRQRRGIALLSGVVLFTFPFFVSNVYLMVLAGIAFMAIPYFIRY